jgi:MoaA/NifB/PqqE/SkfB family radical SAM enzyme
VTWCHAKRSVGAIFNKHFPHIWKLVTMWEEHWTRTARVTKCVRQQKFERCADT